MKRFLDWLNYNTPDVASADEWTTWTREFKKNAPVRYFITQDLPKPFNQVVWKAEHLVDNLRYLIVRYHIVDSGLPRGYHDKPELMLHTNFNLLKDYVEVECAVCMSHSADGKYVDNWKERFIPYYKRMTFRSKELGLEYLEWEITLDDPARGDMVNISQAANAREMLDLYTWWTVTRPSRIDPYEDDDATLEDVAEEKEHILYKLTDEYEEKYPEHHKQWKDWCENTRTLEELWEKEDEHQLIRLVKLRNALWT